MTVFDIPLLSTSLVYDPRGCAGVARTRVLVRISGNGEKIALSEQSWLCATLHMYIGKNVNRNKREIVRVLKCTGVSEE